MDQASPILTLKQLPGFLDSAAPDQCKVFILVDKHTRRHCLPELMDAAPRLRSATELMTGQGEGAKSIARVTRLSHSMLRQKAERSSILINLGGGVISDLGGFTASILKRGIRYINIPTSLLAMVDASHGGKTGVNSGHLKNQLGSFHFPEAVVVHPPFLNTLPAIHLRSGFAEMLKHGLIDDATHFHDLNKIQAINIPEHQDLILSSAAIKQRIVEKDPRDEGVRNTLNFGHTAGHALESYSIMHKSRSLSHGHAVALGMMAETLLSSRLSGLSTGEHELIQEALRSRYDVPKYSSHDLGAVMKLMAADKKIESGTLRLPLLNSIGKASHTFSISHEEMEEALRQTFSC
jgi:3-dehydroquinate synthase